MKKLFLAAFAVFAFASINAQQFGALAGFSNVSADVSGADSDSESGFHIGAFAEFELSDTFDLQPEVTYTSAGDFAALNVNAIVKYSFSEDFNIQLGPQIGFVMGDVADFLDELDDTTKLNLQLAAGVGYDIDENFSVQARYGFQLNDHFTGDGDGEIKFNTLTVGVGYKFGG
ncbi:outer membrane beta-barrel protein [Winogradskyella luteola]|uniref:Porin family protein n=1 Tax=Winogradskyella luteola TaxID=2828330 RepID=A0A9X1JPE7_9FLAO|nr:outer membrane beta-barrel protein [Winogradskyella luteola]MBV7270356.1 porin family protein [Winogradskyella luteola]